MKYLLDTNICIYVIKKKPKGVFERLRQHRVGDIALSSITHSELCYGVANSAHPLRNDAALAEFLAPLEILPYDASVGPVCGRIRAELKRAGTLVGPLDLLIAAHALHVGAVLVTNNAREFSRIPLLRVENWA